jgi:hypothetical protein
VRSPGVSQVMERNRWDTAIRCLEIALHPNTSNDEVLAGVNGFRRTAGGTPLSQVCSEFAGGSCDGGDLAEWKGQLDRLNHENLGLRRQLETAETRAETAAHGLHEAERRIDEASQALSTAQRLAAEAEQQLADFRAAYGRILDAVNQENLDLRAALTQTRREAAEPPVPEAASPFRKFLAEARLGAAQAATVAANPPTAPDRAATGQEPLAVPPSGRQPWTA